MRARFAAAIVLAVLVTAFSGWLLAAAASGARPEGDYRPNPTPTHVLQGAGADARRARLVRAASPRYLSPDPPGLHRPAALPAGHPLDGTMVQCRFMAEPARGTSAKFDCALEGGEVVKVKYGRNAEIHAEAAATRLLAILGYPADHVVIVPRIRCYGCPRFPFLTMKVLSLAQATGLLMPYGYDEGYTDFDWAAVERRFPAAAIETSSERGWAWWELRASIAPPAEIDALRLLAVFLAHWDNKADNQRLVCLASGSAIEEQGSGELANAGGAPGAAIEKACNRPVVMLQDVGATFGPAKVNLARWRDMPVWADRDTCLVSMRGLPSRGATFPDTRISEAGRELLARRLALLSDDDIRTLFAEARFPEFHAGTADEHDLAAWTAAFRHRVEQITRAGPCPRHGSEPETPPS